VAAAFFSAELQTALAPARAFPALAAGAAAHAPARLHLLLHDASRDIALALPLLAPGACGMLSCDGPACAQGGSYAPFHQGRWVIV
jgi:hypothetical protein